MKLLFDENISAKLVTILATDFPNSSHIETIKMQGKTDTVIWNYAKQNSFIIVSKDNDFRQRAFVHGAPPKVIWLDVGNNGTNEIAKLIKYHRQKIVSFNKIPEESLLVLTIKYKKS